MRLDHEFAVVQPEAGAPVCLRLPVILGVLEGVEEDLGVLRVDALTIVRQAHDHLALAAHRVDAGTDHDIGTRSILLGVAPQVAKDAGKIAFICPYGGKTLLNLQGAMP